MTDKPERGPITRATPLFEDFQAGTINVTAAAVSLTGGRQQRAMMVEVQLDPNAGQGAQLLLGNATNQPWVLAPGDTKTMPIMDASKVYLRAAAGTLAVNFFIWT